MDFIFSGDGKKLKSTHSMCAFFLEEILVKLKKFVSNNSNFLITFIVLICLNFFLPRLLPGDPVDIVLGGNEGFAEVTPEMRQEIVVRLGLDKPLHTQFIIYIKNLLRLDFGYSYHFGVPAKELISKYLPWTLLLVSSGLIITLCVGFFLGIESAYKHNKRFDKITLAVMMSLTGFTQFFVGILLLLFFGVRLGWLPVSGCKTACSGYRGLRVFIDVIYHMILPVLTMVITEVTNIYLLSRNTAIIVKKKPFILAGKARGLTEKKIMYSYIGKNTLQPIVNFLGLMFGRIFVGVLMIEVVFSYPGLGTLICQSVFHRDYPVLQAVFFLIALMVLLGSAISEAFNRKFEKM